MIRTSMSRGRALGSFSAAMGLFLAGAVVTTTGSAQSAEPAGDCTEPYPVADIVSALDADQAVPVTTKSVVRGTDPIEFTGEVLGVIDDGIAFDVDMIMVKVTPQSPDEIGGIWQGMSGSPVYAADDRLIGAIAYGLSYGPSWIAGVTPFEDMDDYLAAPAARKVAVGASTARTIANSSEVTTDQAESGFTRLPMPTGVSGVDADRVAQIRSSDTHAWLPKRTFAMGSPSAAASAPGPDTIFAGGNLAASLSYGDVTQAGIGTATSVCDGRVVGFGHPMMFLGETTLTMHPATAIYVQPESLGAPFKVANLGQPAGTITDDHRTGITGAFGALPDTTDITSTVAYDGETRTGSSHVTVKQATAATTFYELVGNHDKVVDGQIPGSELLSWTINGHQADGSTFSLVVTDRYASDFDITFDSAFELADFVWSLSAIPGVTIDEVGTNSQVVDDHATFNVTGFEQRRAGTWVKVLRGEPVFARAGKTLTLRAVLTSATGTTTVPVAVAIPANASGGMARLNVTGGGSVWSRATYPRSVAQAVRYVQTLVRNDQLQVELEMMTRRAVIQKRSTTAPVDKVVYGHKAVQLLVR
ncbi:MAG TPA: hypothetical protein VFT00_00775 [Nocardioides sp.]|nr:hypothetical protein [Nocardioides sp.]